MTIFVSFCSKQLRNRNSIYRTLFKYLIWILNKNHFLNIYYFKKYFIHDKINFLEKSHGNNLFPYFKSIFDLNNWFISMYFHDI